MDLEENLEDVGEKDVQEGFKLMLLKTALKKELLPDAVVRSSAPNSMELKDGNLFK